MTLKRPSTFCCYFSPSGQPWSECFSGSAELSFFFEYSICLRDAPNFTVSDGCQTQDEDAFRYASQIISGGRPAAINGDLNVKANYISFQEAIISSFTGSMSLFIYFVL